MKQFCKESSFVVTNMTFDITRQFQTTKVNHSIVQRSKLNLRQDFHKSSRVFFKNLISFWLFKKLRKIFHYALWKVAKKSTEWLKLRHLKCKKLELFRRDLILNSWTAFHFGVQNYKWVMFHKLFCQISMKQILNDNNIVGLTWNVSSF